jgi:sec-independent protein translocase protein TatA
MRPGVWQLLIVLLIILLLFGARRLPDLAGSIGRSMREFRRGMDDQDDERDTSDDDHRTEPGHGA